LNRKLAEHERTRMYMREMSGIRIDNPGGIEADCLASRSRPDFCAWPHTHVHRMTFSLLHFCGMSMAPPFIINNFCDASFRRQQIRHIALKSPFHIMNFGSVFLVYIRQRICFIPYFFFVL
jgi:hypothetical protein